MSERSSRDRLPWLQPAVLCGCLIATGSIGVRAVSGQLGANPIATALNQLGLLGLVLLMGSLACRPLKERLHQSWSMRLRKTLGLMGFFVILLHLLVYVVVDHGMDLRVLLDDVRERPFILAGMTAFVLLVPLALTSTKRSMKRLGGRRWKRVHRLVYLAVPLGVVHYAMRVKADLTEPLIYGMVVALLLLARVKVRRARS